MKDVPRKSRMLEAILVLITGQAGAETFAGIMLGLLNYSPFVCAVELFCMGLVELVIAVLGWFILACDCKLKVTGTLKPSPKNLMLQRRLFRID